MNEQNWSCRNINFKTNGKNINKRFKIVHTILDQSWTILLVFFIKRTIFRIILKKRSFFPQQTISSHTFFKKNSFLLKKTIFFLKTLDKSDFFRTIDFYQTNDFSEQPILLNEQFHRTIIQRKTNEIDGKWTRILRTNEINVFIRLKKTNEMGRSRTMNERNTKKPNAPISSIQWAATTVYQLFFYISTFQLHNFNSRCINLIYRVTHKVSSFVGNPVPADKVHGSTYWFVLNLYYVPIYVICTMCPYM